jgi:hypothetical protein
MRIVKAAGRPPEGLCACELRVTWYPAKPPVADLEFEMDCRTVSVERLEMV